MNTLITILMLEDSKDDAEYINTFLIKRSGLKFVSTVAATKEEFATALERNSQRTKNTRLQFAQDNRTNQKLQESIFSPAQEKIELNNFSNASKKN